MKKTMSIILVAIMLASMMTMMIPTASAAWDGTSASATLIGSGTEVDPYLISSENDLAHVAKQVNDGTTHYEGQYLKLAVDLDLGGKEWSPIGALKANYFSGHFDGDGHTITGLFVKTIDDSAAYAGVFGRILDGSVKNLNVDGAVISSAKYAGAIAGVLNVTVETGSASITNCHSSNCSIRGLQPAGIVGRCSTKKATKGQIEVTGCSSISNTMGFITGEEYPSASLSNFYMGGIVGASGVAIISGCWVENAVINAHGTGNPWIGGIVGVHGADSVSSDINNCYVKGVTINVDPVCSPTSGSYGGLIGKAAHVAVSYGDSNTEANVFNCFVSNVTINNPTDAVNLGILMGLVNDTIYFNDLYYTAQSDLPSYGYDKYYAEWPFMEVTSVGDLNADNLNKGNSTTVWKFDAVAGHPVIDVEAVIANEPNFVDYYVEHADDTTAEETTEKTEDTTAKPEETNEPTTETTTEPSVESTKAPEANVTDAPGTQAPAKEEKGCGGMLASGAIVVALLGTAVVFKKRK